MDKCIFCLIANKEIKSEIVYEDELFIAFADIKPKAKVHVLLIPKNHINNASDLKENDQDFVGKLILSANKIAKTLHLKEGYRLVLNIGNHSGAEVEHLHLHILGGNKLGDIA